MSKLMRRSVSEGGFTLIEGLISMALLSITVIGIYNIVIVAHRFTIDARRVTQATNYARKKLERIMDTSFLDIESKYVANNSYDANPYDEHYCDIDPDYDYVGSYDDSLPNAEWQVEYFKPSSGNDPLTIRLTVSWRESDEDSRERRVQLSSRVTAGKM